MTDNVPRSPETPDIPVLPDISQWRLREFLETHDSPLAHSLRRVRDAKRQTATDQYAAFGNTP